VCSLIGCIHNTAGCQTSFVSDIAIFVLKTDVKLQLTNCQTTCQTVLTTSLYTRYNRLLRRFDNGFDNRLYRVYKHLTGCQNWFNNRLYRVNGALVPPHHLPPSNCPCLRSAPAVDYLCVTSATIVLLECGPMPNVMVALLNVGGAFCPTPQSLADTHY